VARKRGDCFNFVDYLLDGQVIASVGVKGVFRIAPFAAKGAACQPDKYAGDADQESFALQ
jgi:hypothetical protein